MIPIHTFGIYSTISYSQMTIINMCHYNNNNPDLSLFVTNEQIGEVHRLQKNPEFKRLKRIIGLRSEILNTQHSIQKLDIKNTLTIYILFGHCLQTLTWGFIRS